MRTSLFVVASACLLAIGCVAKEDVVANGARIVTRSEQYDSGALRRQIEEHYDSAGKLTKTVERSWYEQGTPAQHIVYDSHGHIDGFYEWYSSGQFESALSWDIGPPGGGTIRSWYENGRQESYAEVSRTLSGDPIPNGHTVSWYSSGQVREVGTHRYGVKVGTWHSFDSQGAVKSIEFE